MGASRRPPLLASVLLAGFLLGAGSPILSDCERRFAAAPEAEESAVCFVDAGRGSEAQQQEAARRVEALLKRHPGHPWLTFYLGTLRWTETEVATELFQTAAGLLAQRKDLLGEIRARSNLVLLLRRKGLEKEVEAEVRRALQVAETTGDPLTVARARLLEVSQLIASNKDLQRAERLLAAVEAVVFPDGPYLMRRDCLFYQANVNIALGRLDAARRLLQRRADLAASQNDRYTEASARYQLLLIVREELALLPDPESREVCLKLARQALEAAVAVGHREMEAKAHAVLGALTRGAEARRHFALCFETAEGIDDKSFCRSAMARWLTAEAPRAALLATDEALDLAQESTDSRAIAYAWRERMRVSWRLGPPDLAVKDSLTALDAIEVLRDRQTGEEGRAEVFATWVGHYHWLAGRLLQEDDLDLAFQVQERMRARALIDALETVRAAPASSTEARKLQARQTVVLAEISQIQRQLLDRGETKRSELLTELRRRERDEQELRDAIAKASPEFSALRRPDFATLEQVRGALAEDEALLSFQIAPWEDMVGDFMGGAWLTVVTRDRVTVHPLRDSLANRTNLRPAVESFSGALSAGGDNPQGAAALYKALLADGLARLDSRVRRLIVVPDDVLHRVPFAALRPEPGDAPLASRYELALTPSATLWLRWREERPPAAENPALVLADPVSLATVKMAATERSAALAIPSDLGELPWAKREGESVVESLGGGSVLRAGDAASEAYLKSNGAARFNILHFATHARTDDVEPDRSFVLLAPGDGKEDGLLQVREIAGLPDLRGRTVVLSACSSASGEILRGEGVMGLARAFFQAEAHTVVASLWPLRDDYGAALFERFYHHLAKGRSVAAALQAAQQDRFEAGAPPEAWAGVVVLGDGDRIPMPGGRGASWILPAALAFLLVSALGLWTWLRGRRI